MSSIQNVYYLSAIVTAGLTLVILAFQLWLLNRQGITLESQQEIMKSQQDVLKSQQKVQRLHMQLDTFIRARELWEVANSEGRLQKLLQEFPRSNPRSPLLLDVDPEILYSAQRVYEFQRFRDHNLDNGKYLKLEKQAIEYVNGINDLAELIEMKLLELTPPLQKWYLALIQGTWLVEPYILTRSIAGKRRWGLRVLRLGWLARLYNDISPLHVEGEIDIPALANARGIDWKETMGFSGVIYKSHFDAFGDDAPDGRTARGTEELPTEPNTLVDKMNQKHDLETIIGVIERIHKLKLEN